MSSVVPDFRLVQAMDLTGLRFGRLLVLRREGRRKWVCQCDCGKVSTPQIGNLVLGVRSCGCLRTEKLLEHRLTHGEAHRDALSAEYRTWRHMRRRCLDARSINYHRYGGRGIGICAEWNDFAAFLRDMGRRPSPNHTLDRLDNARGYSKTNCRWATPVEQSNNRRSNAILTHHGISQSTAMWARCLGLPAATLSARRRRGDSVPKILKEWSPWGEAFDASRF